MMICAAHMLRLQGSSFEDLCSEGSHMIVLLLDICNRLLCRSDREVVLTKSALHMLKLKMRSHKTWPFALHRQLMGGRAHRLSPEPFTRSCVYSAKPCARLAPLFLWQRSRCSRRLLRMRGKAGSMMPACRSSFHSPLRV